MDCGYHVTFAEPCGISTLETPRSDLHPSRTSSRGVFWPHRCFPKFNAHWMVQSSHFFYWIPIDVLTYMPGVFRVHTANVGANVMCREPNRYRQMSVHQRVMLTIQLLVYSDWSWIPEQDNMAWLDVTNYQHSPRNQGWSLGWLMTQITMGMINGGVFFCLLLLSLQHNPSTPSLMPQWGGQSRMLSKMFT